ncbi:zinc finger and SCAN domain-containing protein 31 [Haplochromis burtoni]|uniref:zinc finger and SCAN domain-containing protein 31 n=1 Tax=Haplochromis burtoni TaxID=8153 RepID=UPI001C2DA1DD|nr:zinc finger and SCAN domain-containing protein 31 [Haplochromis burtoni]
MPSVLYLREFINERLTAAAEQIFLEFEKTIVQYEEEIDRQRRLLDITWKPQIKLHRTDVPQQPVCKEEEEVLPEQQLWNQERSSSLDQEEPEAPQIKEEQEELCSSQEGEQLGLKEETDTFMVTETCEESDHSEPEGDREQLLFESSVNNNSRGQRAEHYKEARSTKTVESESKKKHRNNNGDSSVMSESESNTGTGVKSVKCYVCEKTFKKKSQMQIHYRTHTGEKSYSCKTCGKRFSQNCHLSVHMKIHKGEKPFPCNVCEKTFRDTLTLKYHMRVHTGEKPYSCTICGKGFCQSNNLNIHMRTHTGKRPYPCQIGEKRFIDSSTVI